MDEFIGQVQNAMRNKFAQIVHMISTHISICGTMSRSIFDVAFDRITGGHMLNDGRIHIYTSTLLASR